MTFECWLSRAKPNERRWFGALLLSALMVLCGCFGPGTMRRTMHAYDQNHVESEEDLLFSNVARLAWKQPPHFMILTEVDESVTFSASSMFQGTVQHGVTAVNSFQAGPFGAATSENPLFKFVPVQGQDLATRFESSLTDQFVRFLLDDSQHLSLLIPLMVDYFDVLEPGPNSLRVETAPSACASFAFRFTRVLRACDFGRLGVSL